MEAVTALNTLREKINEETERYGRLMQRSFQLSLDISYETSDEVREEKQAENTILETQLTEVDEVLTRFRERLKKYEELIATLPRSADHASTFNASPPSTPQLSPITPASPTLSPRTQPSTPITGSENSVPAGPSTLITHIILLPPRDQQKVPRLPSGLPKFNLDKREDPTLHTKELEYLLCAHDYPVERWTQALITTLTGHGRFCAIDMLGNLPWEEARIVFHQRNRLPDAETATTTAVTTFRQQSGESVHKLIDRFTTLCNQLPNTFSDELKAHYLGKPLKTHYKQQTIRDKPRDLTTAAGIAILVEAAFPPSSGKSHKSARQSPSYPQLPRTPLGATCSYCKKPNHTKDQCAKLSRKNQQAPSSSAPSSVTPASSATSPARASGPAQQHTRSLPPSRPSAPTSRSLNSISSTQQQSSPTVPAIEQQDPVGEEEEYDEFYESQRSLNSITVTDEMPGPNDPICAPMTINGRRVTAIIDSGASHSFMDPLYR